MEFGATDTDIQNVRLVCDESGHCRRQRSERRVTVRESYGYAQPRERYIQRQGHGERKRCHPECSGGAWASVPTAIDQWSSPRGRGEIRGLFAFALVAASMANPIQAPEPR